MAEIREGRTYYGRVWVDGEYRAPLFPSALNVRVGEAGVEVISVIRYLRAYNFDVDAVLAIWGGWLTREDVQAAVDFYNGKEIDRSEIDARLAEEATASP